MTETILTLLISMDSDCWLSLYLVAGLIALLILVQVGKASDEGYLDMADNLGKIVLLSVLGWPYVLAVWIFSWSGWLYRIPGFKQCVGKFYRFCMEVDG